MTLYGYARVSVREPEDKNLDLQVERLVRAGCAMGNVRAEEASGAKDDRGGLLQLLDLVVEGDTLVVTHIDRLGPGHQPALQGADLRAAGDRGAAPRGSGIPVPVSHTALRGLADRPNRDQTANPRHTAIEATSQVMEAVVDNQP